MPLDLLSPRLWGCVYIKSSRYDVTKSTDTSPVTTPPDPQVLVPPSETALYWSPFRMFRVQHFIMDAVNSGLNMVSVGPEGFICFMIYSPLLFWSGGK